MAMATQGPRPPRPPSSSPSSAPAKQDGTNVDCDGALQMQIGVRTGGRFDSVGGGVRRGQSGRRRTAAPPGGGESTPLLRDPGRDDDVASVTSRSSSVASAKALPQFFRSLRRSVFPSETELINSGYWTQSSDDDSLDGGDGFDDEYDDDSDDYSVDADDEVNYTRGYSDGKFNASMDGGSSPGSRSAPSPHQHRHRHNRSLRVRRSLRRRIFLLLTEPQTSIASAAFFVVLIVTIALSNILMMLQTMDSFQFTPPDCVICGGSNEYYSTNDDVFYYGPTLPNLQNLTVSCVCPPVPTPEIVAVEDWIIWFFTVEWILRVVCFEPAPSETSFGKRMKFTQWLSYLMEWTTIGDALAIFPYYIERYEQTNGLLSLRLLRLFRVFQLLRLGQYNTTFTSLINVLGESLLSFNLLVIVLIFGAAFFGSMIYWLEKGVWKYTDYTDPPSFTYMRISADGVSEEPSPFTSIPAAFWWFIVTATTVGYGDTYPTSVGGKCVAGLAMLMGVLVIAFPVSVFSDLWSKELKKVGLFEHLASEGDGTPDSTDRSAEMMEARDLLKGANDETKLGPSNLNGEQGNIQQSFLRESPVLSTIDIETIMSHLKRIDESQGEIRKILHRYQQGGRVEGR